MRGEQGTLVVQHPAAARGSSTRRIIDARGAQLTLTRTGKTMNERLCRPAMRGLVGLTPDAEPELVRGTGHLPCLEDPEHAAGAVRRFLEARAQAVP
jgi:pimeloyl-ACP methyl ester carboxylesterase